jgi:hypothetical protein
MAIGGRIVELIVVFISRSQRLMTELPHHPWDPERRLRRRALTK